MRSYLKQGWHRTLKHFYIIILLFLYELLWGFFLYRTIESIIVPLLRRYPDTLGVDNAVQMFLTEAQFQLLKTDMVRPYLWLFGSLLAGRIILTPLINAGLLYSLHHTTDEGGTKFLQGIRAAWKPVALLYFMETILTLAPAVWLLPRALDVLLSSHSIIELLQRTGPWAGGWIAWALLLHLLFLAMQFGAVSGGGAMKALWSALRHIFPFVGISIVMWAIALLAGLTVTSASMLWAGLFALILNQSYHLVRTIIKVWTVASQYEVWHSKQI
ncbi:hypothetical protein [Paenibacillus spongiae]|uniref:Uncharacterized protein n=1 Tax=Paenibacillus spongiae TaxID=2909671 RepID=A0ABY5SCS2_9BACL|nr:hypothetical protein [Paenibacillus spongiae]UVI30535.1 hypothetical protein L1F29_01185 [Paenibacillus spongiae]